MDVETVFAFDFEPGRYRSLDPTPTLSSCLLYTQEQIKYVFRLRLSNKKTINVEDEWDEICSLTSGKKYDELGLSYVGNMKNDVHTNLRLSIALWVEAKLANNNHDSERSWAALHECKFYLGAAAGPLTAKEFSALGGRKTGSKNDPIKQEVIRLINEYEKDSFDTLRKAVDQIKTEVENFISDYRKELESREEKGINIQDIYRTINDWRRDDPSMKKCFDRVVKGGVKPGRNKGSRNKTFQMI